MPKNHYQTITFNIKNHVGTMTLNRPDKLNAFNARMFNEMMDALNHVDENDEIRALIITGAGKAFCAGADLSAGENTFNYDKRADRPDKKVPQKNGQYDLSHENTRDAGGRLSLRIFSCLKPVIAAINGDAVGVGITAMLPADIRIAAKQARFGFVFTRRGVVPEACSSWFLPRIAGIQNALEWMLSGRLIPAEEAKQAGLVRSLHEPNQLLDDANELARTFMEKTAPVSIALTRQMLWRALGDSHPMEAHKIDSRGIYIRGKSKDAKEGILSFLEKRNPNFPNKVSADMPDFFPWWKEPNYE